MRDPGISLNHCIFDVFHELTAGGKPSTWLPPGELVKPQPDDTLCECAALDCPQINFRNSNKLFHFEKKYRFFNSKFMIFMIPFGIPFNIVSPLQLPLARAPSERRAFKGSPGPGGPNG